MPTKIINKNYFYKNKATATIAPSTTQEIKLPPLRYLRGVWITMDFVFTTTTGGVVWTAHGGLLNLIKKFHIMGNGEQIHPLNGLDLYTLHVIDKGIHPVDVIGADKPATGIPALADSTAYTARIKMWLCMNFPCDLWPISEGSAHNAGLYKNEDDFKIDLEFGPVSDVFSAAAPGTITGTINVSLDDTDQFLGNTMRVWTRKQTFPVSSSLDDFPMKLELKENTYLTDIIIRPHHTSTQKNVYSDSLLADVRLMFDGKTPDFAYGDDLKYLTMLKDKPRYEFATTSGVVPAAEANCSYLTHKYGLNLSRRYMGTKSEGANMMHISFGRNGKISEWIHMKSYGEIAIYAKTDTTGLTDPKVDILYRMVEATPEQFSNLAKLQG